LCHELDDILEKEGKQPFFVPKLKSGVEVLGLGPFVSDVLKKVGIEDLQSLKKPVTVPDVLKNLSDEERIDFEKENPGLTVDKFEKAHNYLEIKGKSGINSDLNKEITKLIESKPFEPKVK
jgi:hypothetical protein